MHLKIKEFWEKQGSVYMTLPGHWFLGNEDDGNAISISYSMRGKIYYYTNLITDETLEEKEMLSYINLQTFL